MLSTFLLRDPNQEPSVQCCLLQQNKNEFGKAEQKLSLVKEWRMVSPCSNGTFYPKRKEPPVFIGCGMEFLNSFRQAQLFCCTWPCCAWPFLHMMSHHHVGLCSWPSSLTSNPFQFCKQAQLVTQFSFEKRQPSDISVLSTFRQANPKRLVGQVY